MNAPLDQLISAIGLPAALKLIERFGGTRIALPLPENVTASNPVAQVIGVERARKLAVLWGQERPYLPRAVQYVRRQRDRQLAEDAQQMSIPQVALKYELTERGVYKVLAALKDKPTVAQQQSALF